MRGVSKPWPPADVYPEGHQPHTLCDAEREYREALPAHANRVSFARTEFDRLDKGKLRAVMYREQGSLCIYCERQIDEGSPAPRIEHWRPLSDRPEEALHWRNLYLFLSDA